MTRTTALLEGTARTDLWSGPVIDADVHASVPSLEALQRYQDPVWVQWAEERGWAGPVGLPIAYPPNAPTTARDEWRLDGAPPGSDPAAAARHVLDPWQVENAVLNCYYAVDSLRHPDWAAALARSVNDWMAAEWLDRDPRLVGSIVVPARDPRAAADEIDRLGPDPRFRQVVLPVRSEQLYGQRAWWPLYEAVTRHDLVLGLHWGGTPDGAPSTSGFPSWYVEEYAAETQVYAGQLVSMIAEGVVRRFPELRVSMLDCGFTWIPTWGWRMNKEWKGLRREIPWVDRPPMDLVREHFRFTTAPIDAGPPEHMAKIVEWLGTDDLLMFATDYPHRHDDDIAAFLSGLGESMRANVMSETARRWYRL
ncbi:MAG: amidohydrolase [Actinomycetota bacterium]|nr:amidohydrolase [Actinomycetota bacterium]